MAGRFICSIHRDKGDFRVDAFRRSSKLYGTVTAIVLTTSACTPIGPFEPEAPRTAERQPVELSAYQMDRVSAAGVSVDITTSGLAKGQYGEVSTDVLTGIVGLGPRQIGYGFGSGDAVACCGDDSEVVLDTTASGTGDYVFTDTYTAYGGDGVTKTGVTQGIVLVLSGPSREELVAATREYLDQVMLAPPSTYRPGTEIAAESKAR
ncbi:MAG: hypothetical protein R3F54_19880 [Alphaproteobacteria bacterium]